MPLAAPVTIATLPSRACVSIISSFAVYAASRPSWAVGVERIALAPFAAWAQVGEHPLIQYLVGRVAIVPVHYNLPPGNPPFAIAPFQPIDIAARHHELFVARVQPLAAQ